MDRLGPPAVQASRSALRRAIGQIQAITPAQVHPVTVEHGTVDIDIG